MKEEESQHLGLHVVVSVFQGQGGGGVWLRDLLHKSLSGFGAAGQSVNGQKLELSVKYENLYPTINPKAYFWSIFIMNHFHMDLNLNCCYCSFLPSPKIQNPDVICRWRSRFDVNIPQSAGAGQSVGRLGDRYRIQRDCILMTHVSVTWGFFDVLWFSSL